MIPQDPVILLSYVNTKLRDQYSSWSRCVTIWVSISGKSNRNWQEWITRMILRAISSCNIKTTLYTAECRHDETCRRFFCRKINGNKTIQS